MLLPKETGPWLKESLVPALKTSLWNRSYIAGWVKLLHFTLMSSIACNFKLLEEHYKNVLCCQEVTGLTPDDATAIRGQEPKMVHIPTLDVWEFMSNYQHEVDARSGPVLVLLRRWFHL